MADLKTTYVDDILNTSKNTKRKYNMIANSDGTVSFEDVTDYSQVGDSFGAAEVNSITAAINQLNSDLGAIEEVAFTKVTNTYADLDTDSSYVYTKNGICYLQLVVKGLGSYSGWANIGQLPFKPEINQAVQGVGTDTYDKSCALFMIDTYGKIYIQPRGTTSSRYCCFLAFPFELLI